MAGIRNKSAEDCRRLDEAVGRAMVQARWRSSQHRRARGRDRLYSMTHEIQAPVTGILSRILVSDGGFVEPGNVLGTINQV